MSGLDESTEPAEHEAPQAHTQGEEAAVAAIEQSESARPVSDQEHVAAPDVSGTSGTPGASETDPVSEAVVSEPLGGSTDAPGPVESHALPEPEPADASKASDLDSGAGTEPGIDPAVVAPSDASGSGQSDAPAVVALADASGSAEVEAKEPAAPSDASDAGQSGASPALSDASGAPNTDQSEVPAAPATADASGSADVEADASSESPEASESSETSKPPEPTPQIGATKEAGGRTVVPPAAQRPRSITETGKIVEGVVTAVSADSVELTLDDGRPAVINRPNFSLTDEEPSAVLSVGDRAFGAELAREDPKARVVLSRTWALKRQAWERIVDHASDNKLLSGKVVSASKKGLVIDAGVRGFVPVSHLELGPVADINSYVGQTLELKVLEVDPRREKLVLSRRSQLLKAQRKEIQELLQSLKPGEVRSGTVASLADYGAFVDLGGVSGLVHISELSWQRVGKPAQVVSVGDKVDVKILDIKPKKKRISLSIRQVTSDPLESIEVGSVLVGAVTRLVDFGAFVAIGEFEGLVHLSELAEYRVSTPEEIVAPGDEVGVKVLSIDTKRRRIELSIRRAAEYGG